MARMVVNGDLALGLETFVDSAQGAIAVGGFGTLTFSSGLNAGTSISGNGLRVASTGNVFLEGEIDEISVSRGEIVDISQPIQFIDLIDITQLRFVATDLFDFAGRQSNTVSGLLNQTYFFSEINVQDWQLFGGVGDDSILPTETFFLTGRDTIDGGFGADTLDGGAGDDSILAGLGDDVIRRGSGNDTIDAGGGTDTIEAESADILLDRVADGAIRFIDNTDQTIAFVYNAEAANLDGLRVDLTEIVLADNRGNNRVEGTARADQLSAGEGDDTMLGGAGDDVLEAGDGADSVVAGDGDDIVVGGRSFLDLRDLVYGGAGNDNIDGGYGNDELRGDAGNDSIAGGFGVDTVIGGAGDDVMTGSAFSDLVFGGDGNDFVNGGFGSDRVNGGDGADRFFHIGLADHGSDWIQDFDHAEGDVLVYGGRATRDQFQVNYAVTEGAGARDTAEAFVIHRPTGQILWALIDGAQNDSLILRIDGDGFDLLA